MKMAICDFGLWFNKRNGKETVLKRQFQIDLVF